MPRVALLIGLSACGRFGFVNGTPDSSVMDGADETDGDVVDAAQCQPGGNAHDEDGDGVVDPCDNCPTIANPGQEDALEAAPDGVGDVCDPRPTASGDSLVAFDPFVGSVLAPRWTVQSGTWTMQGDAVAQSASGTDQRMFDADAAVAGIDVVVETRLTFDGFDPGDRNAGVAVRLRPGAGDGWVTGVFRSQDDTTGALKVWLLTGGTAGNPTEMAMAPPQVGETYLLRASAVGTSLTSTANGGTSVVVTDTVGMPGALALRTNRARATYHYYAVYRVAGPLP